MATYKLIGSRFLRKYTAKSLSPAYAAALDAQTVVDDFCTVPWQPVLPKSSQLAYHTDEVVDEESGRTGLDENVAIRDSLDAALFCAEHKGGMHRAFAQALCLRFTLPDDAVGASLSSLKLKISSDPYNSGGCRVSAFTNSSGEIPTNCSTVRAGSVHADAQVPRTSQTSSGTTYWYAAQGDVTLTPESAITLQKYLFVFFGLEDYSITRGNWLEGSATLRNLVEITTTADVTGWTDGETYDLSNATSALESICMSTQLAAAWAYASGISYQTCYAAGIDLPTSAGGTISNLANTAPSTIQLFYSKFVSNQVSETLTIDTTNRPLTFAKPIIDSDNTLKVLGYAHSYVFAHYYLPEGFTPSKFRFSLSTGGNWSGTPPAEVPASTGASVRIWTKPSYVTSYADLVKDTRFSVAETSNIDGWILQGSIDLLNPNRIMTEMEGIVDPATGDDLIPFEYSCPVHLGDSRIGTILVAPFVDPVKWNRDQSYGINPDLINIDFTFSLNLSFLDA